MPSEGVGGGEGEQRDRDICKKSKKKLHEIGSAANGFSEATKDAGLPHWNCRPGRWAVRQAGWEGGQAGRGGGQAGKVDRQAGNLGYAVACGSSSSGRQTSWAGALLQLLLPACCCCCCCFPNSL